MQCFVCDSASVFSKQDFTGSLKHTEKHLLHCVASFNCDDYVRQVATQIGYAKLLAKLSERHMIAREACYCKNCITKFRNKYRKFSEDQKNYIKDVQKSLEAIAVPKCMSFIEDS